MSPDETTLTDRLSGRYRWLGTFLLGASVPMALQQVGDMLMWMNNPINPAGTPSLLAQGTLLATILLLGALSFRMMRTGRAVSPPLIFLLIALVWVGVLI